MIQKWQAGRLTRKWVATRKRNEALDMRVYATAALYLLNPDFEAIAAGIKGQAEELAAKERKGPETADRSDDGGDYRPRKPKRRNWVTDY
jgi:phage terminase large subunit GpA-like protein